jgi:serine/threonine protein kinase
MQLEQLGPYRIGRRIGRGGMGTVYHGTNVESGQPAAIKVLSARLAIEEGFRERFETEIETLKKLKHPNIVRLYGFGEEAGYLYYVMELVEGTNVEDELQAGRRFNWREATRLGIKLAKAGIVAVSSRLQAAARLAVRRRRARGIRRTHHAVAREGSSSSGDECDGRGEATGVDGACAFAAADSACGR